MMQFKAFYDDSMIWAYNLQQIAFALSRVLCLGRSREWILWIGTNLYARTPRYSLEAGLTQPRTRVDYRPIAKFRISSRKFSRCSALVLDDR